MWFECVTPHIVSFMSFNICCLSAATVWKGGGTKFSTRALMEEPEVGHCGGDRCSCVT